MNSNIPKQITQGDRANWFTELPEYNPTTVSCFIRGASNPLDLTAIPQPNLDGTIKNWLFTISEAQSIDFTPGKYKAQLVIYDPNRKTIDKADLIVCPSFENLTELETRTSDEIELENITMAIAKLASGAVAEYRIGDRMMRYQDMAQLTQRQKYLRNRIAIASGKMKPGGRNVGVRFCN